MVITSNQLAEKALENINEVHQAYNTWITFSHDGSDVTIHSFYRRVFDLIERNDFEGSKKKKLTEIDEGMMGYAFLKLCDRFKFSIDEEEIIEEKESPSPIEVSVDFCLKDKMSSYQKLFTMDQDYKINQTYIESCWQKFEDNSLKNRKFNGYYAE